MIEHARRIIKGVLFVFAAIYPVFVYFALIHWHWDVRYLVGLLIAMLVVRLAFDKGQALTLNKLAWFPVLALLALGIVFNGDISLRFYPVLMNGVMLYVFAASLLYPPTVIERLARIAEPDMSDAGIRYTRNLTKIWCFFFIINGGIACYTALFSSYEIWAWYNGFIAYLGMGLMFLIEYPIRLYVKKREQAK